MKKYLIQLIVGIGIAIAIMYYRTPQMAEGISGNIVAISDGFAVVGLLYFGFGGLMLVSTTGFFDIFGYAFKKGAHAFIPNYGADLGNYYDYKMERKEARGKGTEKSTLILGVVFLLISGLFTIIWYQVA